MAQSIDAGERDAVEERLHVGERRHRHAALADLAGRQRMIRITAHQCRQIERDAEARTAGREQLVIPLVGLSGSPEARKLPHGPQLAAVPIAVEPTGERGAAGIADVASVLEVADVVGRVDALGFAGRHAP
jgi:hypothetical protein